MKKKKIKNLGGRPTLYFAVGQSRRSLGEKPMKKDVATQLVEYPIHGSLQILVNTVIRLEMKNPLGGVGQVN